MSQFNFGDILTMDCTIKCNEKYPHEWYKTSGVCKEFSEWFEAHSDILKHEHDAESYSWKDCHTTIFEVCGRILGVRGRSLIYPHVQECFYIFEMEKVIEINYVRLLEN